MSDNKPSFPMRVVALTVLVSAGMGALFGFAGGLIAGEDALRSRVLSSVAPGLHAYLEKAGRERADADRAAAEAAARADLEREAALMSEEDKIIKVVETASPAVVSIVVSRDMPVYEQYYEDPFGGNDFFRQFFGDMPGFQLPQYRQKGTEKREVGAGTGFLVTEDGYIVTNKHVVADEGDEYTVILSDERKFEATVLARDPVNDIAVLKIEGEGFPTVPFGDSDAVKVGQRAVAIGFALGRFGNTVSTGIVSGLSRSIRAGDAQGRPEDLYDVIQTDTAINPGNSGGPLLNLRGEAIGVNVAIVQGSQNIGFALPINDVKSVVESVRKDGRIVRPFIGVRYVMITKAIMDANQLPVDHGALVVRGETQTDLAVMPGSPADAAGIVENDIILEVDGKKLTEDYPLALAIRRVGVGDTITLKVLHKGEERTVQVTLTERK